MDGYVTSLVSAAFGSCITEKIKELREAPLHRPPTGARLPTKKEDFFPFTGCLTKTDYWTCIAAHDVYFPYRVLVATGPAGSGKTHSFVTNVIPTLGDVLVTASTNAAAGIICSKLKEHDVPQSQSGHTIHRTVANGKVFPQTDVHFPKEFAADFRCDQWRKLAMDQQALEDSLTNLETMITAVNDKKINKISGNETVARDYADMYPARLPRLTTAKYIVIDESSMVPAPLANRLVVAWYFIRCLLGLDITKPPVLILIGSPTQTAAHADVIERRGGPRGDYVKRTKVVPSVIDDVFCNPVVADFMQIQKFSVRFVNIKRCGDPTYNDYMYRMEHGQSLRRFSSYFDRFVVPEVHITDPSLKFNADYTRIFLSHAAVADYTRNYFSKDPESRIRIPIYCVVSKNDAERCLGHHAQPTLTAGCGDYLKREAKNLSNFSQFADTLDTTDWDLKDNRRLCGDDDDAYRPVGDRNQCFFDSSLTYDRPSDLPVLKDTIVPATGFDDETTTTTENDNNPGDEKKQVFLYENTTSVTVGSKVVVRKRLDAFIVGFDGTFETMVDLLVSPAVSDSLHLGACLLEQGACTLYEHATRCPQHDASKFRRMVTDIIESRGNSREIIANHYTPFIELVLEEMRRCVQLNKVLVHLMLAPGGCDLDFIDPTNLAITTLFDGTECTLRKVFTFPKHLATFTKCFEKYAPCMKTFTEIQPATVLVNLCSNGLACVIIPKPVLKQEGRYEMAVLYDLGIASLLATTAAKATGSSLSGVCCVFPRKHLDVNTAYVMLTRVAGKEPCIFINENPFCRHKPMTTAIGDKSQFILQQQMFSDSTLFVW